MGNDRVAAWLNVTRRSMQDMISEKLLYLADDAEDKCKEMDEQLCRSLRWAPIIRNDEISFEPEKGDDDDEEEDAENVSGGGDDAEVPDSPSPEDADDDAKEEE